MLPAFPPWPACCRQFCADSQSRDHKGAPHEGALGQFADRIASGGEPHPSGVALDGHFALHRHTSAEACAMLLSRGREGREMVAAWMRGRAAFCAVGRGMP